MFFIIKYIGNAASRLEALARNYGKVRKTMKVEKITEVEKEVLKTAGIEALKAAKRVHDELGESGLTPVVSPNQFGEQALRGDVEAEKAVLDTLSAYKIPIRVISEEHGIINITSNPKYLGVLDGIDGTANYRAGRNKLRYTTMLGMYANLDPYYRDYIFSGMMEHPSSKLWYALFGKGSLALDLNSQEQAMVKPNNIKSFTPECRIYTALSYRETPIGRMLEESLSSYGRTEVTSASISYLDIASSVADLEAEITRKKNLEQMIAFGFLKEAGAVMINLQGNDLGTEKYFQFGQETSEGIITAASHELALDFLNYISSSAK